MKKKNVICTLLVNMCMSIILNVSTYYQVNLILKKKKHNAFASLFSYIISGRVSFSLADYILYDKSLLRLTLIHICFR